MDMESFIFSLIGGIIASVIVTFVWAIILKPRLGIENEEIVNGKFRVKLTNKQCFYSVSNIKIEVCKITKDEITKHLPIDKDEHLFLKHGKYRIFKAEVSIQDEQDLKDNKVDIRVHVSANHSFSGFGKEYEKIYRYNSKTGKYLVSKK